MAPTNVVLDWWSVNERHHDLGTREWRKTIEMNQRHSTLLQSITVRARVAFWLVFVQTLDVRQAFLIISN